MIVVYVYRCPACGLEVTHGSTGEWLRHGTCTDAKDPTMQLVQTRAV